MYSVADFNNDKRARKPKCLKTKPILNSNKTKQMKKCKVCGRQILSMQNKHDTDTENKQSGDVFSENTLLIWKYVKNALSNRVQNDSQKCTFKIIVHKSYRKRSLHQVVVSTNTYILSQICNICEKRKIQKNNFKEIKADDVLNEKKYTKKKECWIQKKSWRNKLGKKTSLVKDLAVSNKEIQWKEIRGTKQSIKLCTKNLSKFTNTTAFKKVASKGKLLKTKQNPRRAFLRKKKFNTIKKKRLFLKENRKKVNRFAKWQYMQHALVGEESITNYINEDKAPIYLTLEEYCLILAAIDTRTNTAEKFGDINIEDVNVSTEDVGTNTELLIGHSGDAYTNTEVLCGFAEEGTTNTELVNESIDELDCITTRTNEISEEFDIYTEQLSESTETSDPLTEATDQFDINTDELSDTIIDFETNGKPENEVKQRSLVDIHEIDQSDTILPEEIEKIAKTNDEGDQSKENSKEQTYSREVSFGNTLEQQDETIQSTYSENQAEEGSKFVEN